MLDAVTAHAERGQIFRMLEANVRSGAMTAADEDTMFTLGGEPCVMCDGVRTSAVPRNFAPALAAAAVEPPYPGAPCVCQGPRRTPGVENKHFVACWDMWTRLAARKPWEKLRMRHVIKVEAPWVKGGWQFVQIVGGSGTVDPGIRIARSDREVGVENGYYNPHADVPERRMMLQVELEQDRMVPFQLSSFVAYSMAGIKATDPSKTLVEQRSAFFSIFVLSKQGGLDKNAPLAGPGQADDGISGRCMRQYQPNADAYAALHACMAGILVALDTLEPGPSTGLNEQMRTEAGNERTYYPLKKQSVVEGADNFKGARKAGRKAVVTFPFTQNSDIMSESQRIAVARKPPLAALKDAGGFSGWSDDDESEAPLPTKQFITSSILPRATALKSEGNREFGRGTKPGFEKAHRLYSDALDLFPKGLQGSFDRFDDNAVEELTDKIQGNRVLCSRRLGEWHRVVAEATALIGMRTEGLPVAKAMYSRGLAYEELKRYETAILDFFSVRRYYRWQEKWDDVAALNEKIESLKVRTDSSNTGDILSWRRLETSGEGPGPRVWHTAVFWKNKLFIYGGHANLVIGGVIRRDDHAARSTDVWILDYETKHWMKKPTSGRGPGHLSHHTACVREGLMWVFGGMVKDSSESPAGRDRLKYFFTLDLESLLWKRVRQKTQGPPRVMDHGAFIHGRRLYVLGGVHEHDSSCVPKVDCKLIAGFYSFNFKTSKWRKEPLPGGDDCPAGTATEGSAICVKGDRAFVFGGVFPNHGFSGNLYFFDLKARQWSSGRATEGTWPLPRSEMRAIALGNSVVFHGGYCESAGIGSRYLPDTCRLDMGSGKMKWQRSGKLAVQADSLGFGRGKDDPSPGCRAASSLTPLPDNKHRAVLYGGYETLSQTGQMNAVLDDFWELTVSPRRRSKPGSSSGSSSQAHSLK